MLRLLGPVRWETAAGQLDLGTIKQRTMLAALAVDAGRLVSWSELIDRAWDEAPANGTRRLYTYANRIRRLLETIETAGGPPARLARRSGGYLLQLDPDHVDVHRFRRLQAAAGERQRPDAERARLLGEALELWQGSPLADLPGEWSARMRLSWCPCRLEAAVAWAEAQLRLDQPAPVIGLVRDLAAEYPLAEALTGALMRALAGVGRHAEALECYAGYRARLVEQLGAEPGPELRGLHEALLRGGLPGRPPARRSVSRGVDPARRAPAQLPGDVPSFTGRRTELATLDSLLAQLPGGPPWSDRVEAAATAVVVSAVSGTAGVGKTALAIHWAHRVAAQFPDGQLYVNLRGYDPEQPLSAADAVARLLAGLGLAGHEVPVELDERAARYRSEVAGRRLLVVLDNASSVEQVRPMLPGTASVLVLVTSRDRLAGLIAVHGARRVDLDVLPLPEAVSLLRILIGCRVDDDHEAAEALARECARLPLALRVAAEMATRHPARPLAELVAELSDLSHRLDLLDAGGDHRSAVRSVLSWSYQQLSPDAALAFRMLGLHPGADFDAHAAAALADTHFEHARDLLDLLAQVHLLQSAGGRRYSMHDLLSAYATEQFTVEDNSRRAALQRLFDYYLATAAAAMDKLYPAESHWRPRIPPPATPTPALHNSDTARDWLNQERPNLIAVTIYAADHGWPAHATRLGATLYRHLDGGNHTDALAVHGSALRGAEQTDDRAGAANALRGLGSTHFHLGRYEQAANHFRQALNLYRQAGDHVGEVRTLDNLGTIHERMGHYRQAADHYQHALSLFRRVGDRVGQARALTNLGTVEWRLGHQEQAADHLRQALQLYRQAGDQTGEARALDHLGLVDQRRGQYEQAADHHQQALTLYRQFGNRDAEAAVLDNLGTVHTHLGRPHLAADYHRQALALLDESGDRDTKVWVLNGLGEAAFAAGNPTEAVTWHTDARTLATEIGDRDQSARAHAGLGHAHHTLGDVRRARDHYRHALALYTDLGQPEADDIRTGLATLDSTTPAN